MSSEYRESLPISDEIRIFIAIVVLAMAATFIYNVPKWTDEYEWRQHCYLDTGRSLCGRVESISSDRGRLLEQFYGDAFQVGRCCRIEYSSFPEGMYDRVRPGDYIRLQYSKSDTCTVEVLDYTIIAR